MGVWIAILLYAVAVAVLLIFAGGVGRADRARKAAGERTSAATPLRAVPEDWRATALRPRRAG